MKLTFIKKVRKVGGALVVTIPSEIIDIANLVEGDYIQAQIEAINNKSEKKIKIKEVYKIPEELKESIKQALPIIYKVENKINKETAKINMINQYKKDKNTLPSFIEPTDLKEFWTTASHIKEIIEINNLYEFNNDRNIYVDIGTALAELGFITKKRTGSGIKRLIPIDKLNLPNDIYEDEKPYFKLVDAPKKDS